MDHSLNYKVHTFGCKVNTYDSGLIEKNLNQSGMMSSEADDVRIHVLNTCAVTAEATKEAVRQIRRLKAKDPFCTVVVTGCGAQVDTEHFTNLPGADLVIANSHKGQMPSILDQFFKGQLKEKVFKSNIFKKEDLEAGGGLEKGHTRSFLKIQDGCNSFCTYCIIPFARGKSRSLTINELTRRVQELSQQGIREVVLTGVHIGDYADESKLSPSGRVLTLEDLIESLLKNTKDVRFRLTSLEPVEISDRLLELYADPRLCPHFHMSIQSANTEVLHLMKRKYGQQEVAEALLKIEEKVPGAFVGMDVIAGFCNETQEHFEDTYLTLAQLPWTRIHVFPYSERPGTRAMQYSETVELRERNIRSQRLRELSNSRFEHHAKNQIGTIKQGLVLKTKVENKVQVLSEDYWNIEIAVANIAVSDLAGSSVNELGIRVVDEKGPAIIKGEIRPIRVIDYDAASAKRLEGVLKGVFL